MDDWEGSRVTAKHSAWNEAEDDTIRELVATHSAAMIRDSMPWRTVGAIYKRIGSLGIGVGRGAANARNPFAVSNRPLLAKTCRACGLLLPATWYRASYKRGAKGWHSTCRKCLSTKAAIRNSGAPKSQVDSMRKYRRDHGREWRAKAQALTLRVATNKGNEYTEADHAVLADPSLTNLEKALRLRRTYASVATLVCAHSYASHRTALGSAAHDRWLIDNPNASRVEEITAALKREFAEAGVQFPEWDWDDDDLKESA